TLSGINLKTDNYFQYTSMLNEIRVKNASAFAFKRKYVLLETQVRLTLNVSAFGIERKGVLA
ncbi:hypothetical protein, partial [Phocaeicola plebeius]|uniref:hypothetical protein n=1 Tax=Phocaeicola plebeius TaxID=310297 RepID=UPI0026F319E8